MNYNDLVRPATADEINSYDRIQAILDTLDDEIVSEIIDKVGELVFYCKPFAKTPRSTLYSRVYRLAKRYGVTVHDFTTWYCID